ncbi:MAG: hypothetical protein LBH80_06080 [Prevotellaceae bacterium]|nr:hypothetical protein [Prevotellaceae bacterium]
MKKFNLRFLLSTATLLIAGEVLFAQPIAYESAVQYNKLTQVTAAADFRIPSKNVTGGLKTAMKKRGYSPKSSKGFLVFDGILDIQTGSQMSFIFKVDRKNRQKDLTTVNLFANGPTVNMADVRMVNTLKQFLENMYPEINAYYLEQDIAAQKKILEKEQRDYEKLMKNTDNLLKQKEKIESRLQKNDESIALQKNALENQQKTLDVLTSGKR